MYNLRLALTFVFAMVLFSKAKAQNTNYIITLQGDTLTCYFRDPLFSSGNIKYRTDTLKKFTNLDPSMVKAYHREGDKYVHYAVLTSESNAPDFLELMVAGKISLYQKIVTAGGPLMTGSGVFMNTTRSTSQLYYRKTGYERAVIVHKKTKDLFNLYLADTPVAQKVFQNQFDFSHETVFKAVKFYNAANAKNESSLK